MEDIGESSYTALKYGKLIGDWRDTLREGFAECFRVLRPGGTLIFKWCEYDVPVAEVLALTPEKPLYGHRSGKQSKTHWIAFLKSNDTAHGRLSASRAADCSQDCSHVYTTIKEIK
jgi:SAM-dependent methyltransferase